MSSTFISLGKETVSGILRTKVLSRPGALRFENIADTYLQVAFQCGRSFQVHRQQALSIFRGNLFPNLL